MKRYGYKMSHTKKITKKDPQRHKDASYKDTLIEHVSRTAQMWEQMDQIVKAEWHLLLKNDVGRLIRISRIKQELASRIKDEEQNISMILAGLLDAKEKVESRYLAKILEQHMGSKMTNRFLLLLRKRDYFRNLASVTNRRIFYWIEERLGFFDHVTKILSGADLKQGPTYGPATRHKGVQTMVDNCGQKINANRHLNRGFSAYLEQSSAGTKG